MDDLNTKRHWDDYKFSLMKLPLPVFPVIHFSSGLARIPGTSYPPPDKPFLTAADLVMLREMRIRL